LADTASIATWAQKQHNILLVPRIALGPGPSPAKVPSSGQINKGGFLVGSSANPPASRDDTMSPVPLREEGRQLHFYCPVMWLKHEFDRRKVDVF
jgi:hypothetical protein